MKNKGITLIALIVTIIIMLILAGVTINLVNDGGAIQKTKDAVNSYNEAAEIEELELAKVAATDYKTGEVDKDVLEENLPEEWTVDYDWDGTIKCISPSGKEFTGIGTSEFIIEIKDEFGNKYKYYRIDKVTEEQREKFREQGIPMIAGDGNLNGKIDDEDIEIIKKITSGSKIADKYQKVILDFNLNGRVDSLDLPIGAQLNDGTISLINIAIHMETGIDEKKIIQDDKTGKIYFIEEKVTKEEADELEKYGVKRLILGDVDLDGKLTQNDVNLISEFHGGEKTPTKIEKMLADMNQNNDIDPSDVSIINGKVNN